MAVKYGKHTHTHTQLCIQKRPTHLFCKVMIQKDLSFTYTLWEIHCPCIITWMHTQTHTPSTPKFYKLTQCKHALKPSRTCLCRTEHHLMPIVQDESCPPQPPIPPKQQQHPSSGSFYDYIQSASQFRERAKPLLSGSLHFLEWSKPERSGKITDIVHLRRSTDIWVGKKSLMKVEGLIQHLYSRKSENVFALKSN